MKINYIITAILTILLFAFPPKAQAGEISIWRLSYSEESEYVWEEEIIIYEDDFDEKVFEAFEKLFEDDYDGYVFPSGTKLLYISFFEGHLIINVSKEIRNYGGGRFYENTLAAQIIKTGLDIPGADKVTLLIDGLINPLPEGTIIKEVPK